MTRASQKFSIRRHLHGATTLLSILLVLGILSCIEIIAHNHNHVIDLTPEKEFTLSPKSLDVLHALEGPVDIVTFYETGARDQYARILELLAAASRRVAYELIDINRNPGKARLYGARASGDTFIDHGGRRKKVVAPGEDTLVRTILQLTGNRQKTLFLAKGHGERDLHHSLRVLLENENWHIERLLLPQAAGPPEDTDAVLLVNDPREDFFKHEIGVLEQFVEAGGSIIVLLEPFTRLPVLEAFLREYRILLENDILMDRENKLMAGDVFTPIVPYVTNAAFLAQLRAPLVFSTARSVQVADKLQLAATAKVLASSGDHSWARSGRHGDSDGVSPETGFAQDTDRPGPVPVAAWVTLDATPLRPSAAGGEIVCIGDADFIDASLLDMLGNKDFIMNVFNHLGRDAVLVSSREDGTVYPYRPMDASQGRFLFWSSVVVPPLLFLGLAIATIVHRSVRG